VGDSPPSPSSTAAQSGVVLDEWFADNSRHWLNDAKCSAWVADGAYNLVTRQPANFPAVGIPGTDHLGDATIAGSFRKTGGQPGGGYGLILRAQDPGSLDGVNQNGRFYVFEVGDQGDFGIWLRDNDHWVDIVPWSPSNAVKAGTGAANDLTVTASGDRLSFKVNDTEVASQLDAQLHSGSAGVFVGGDGNQVQLYHLTVSISH
jgi:hypothetical protein